MSETELIRGTIQDPISTTDTRGAKLRSESVLAKAQLAVLGSVLIATVTFSAAFTLPGGTNQDTGKPILSGKYLFKAFILADFAAFFFSFLATMMLIYSSTDGNADRMEIFVARSMKIFTVATKCMVMAPALGLSLVLAPNGAIIAFVICVFTFYLFFFDNPYILWHRLKGLFLENLLLKHIPDGASGQNRVVKDISYFTYEFYKPTVVPCILIFVLALF